MSIPWRAARKPLFGTSEDTPGPSAYAVEKVGRPKSTPPYVAFHTTSNRSDVTAGTGASGAGVAPGTYQLKGSMSAAKAKGILTARRLREGLRGGASGAHARIATPCTNEREEGRMSGRLGSTALALGEKNDGLELAIAIDEEAAPALLVGNGEAVFHDQARR